MSDPDAALVAQAREQLPYVDTAYKELMLRYERLLFQVCRRLLSRPDDAEEVVQETMIKAYHHLKNFEGRSKFKTWLLLIAKRECYTHYHKNKRHYDLEDVNELIETQSYQTENTSPGHAQIDAKMQLEHILSKVDIEDREVLTLRYIAQLELSEIAEALDLGLSATKMRLYRALERAKQAAASD